jgi:hypothetical protein
MPDWQRERVECSVGEVPNMTNQQPCSCDGSNESCARCYGRGFIEAGVVGGGYSRTKEAGSQSHDSLALSATLSSAQSTVKCPACSFKGSTDEFTRHFALGHGSKGRRRRRIQVPMVCVAVGFPPFGVGKTERNAGTRHAMKSCPLCKSQVREDRLQKHMSSRCAVRPNKPPVQVAMAKQRVKKSADNAPESLRYKGIEVERPSWWNNLDATKDYGYPAREAGRYGSHPSHDGFDDESKP